MNLCVCVCVWEGVQVCGSAGVRVASMTSMDSPTLASLSLPIPPVIFLCALTSLPVFLHSFSAPFSSLLPLSSPPPSPPSLGYRLDQQTP